MSVTFPSPPPQQVPKTPSRFPEVQKPSHTTQTITSSHHNTTQTQSPNHLPQIQKQTTQLPRNHRRRPNNQNQTLLLQPSLQPRTNQSSQANNSQRPTLVITSKLLTQSLAHQQCPTEASPHTSRNQHRNTSAPPTHNLPCTKSPGLAGPSSQLVINLTEHSKTSR